VSRFFIRIFLCFWIGSTFLLLGLAVGLWIVRPDILASFRFIRQSGMLHVGSQAVDAYEAGGKSNVAALLQRIREEVGFHAWLYDSSGAFLAGPNEIEDAAELVARTIAENEVESPGPGRMRPVVVARRITGDTGSQYVLIWEAPLQISQLLSPQLLSIRVVVLLLTGGVACLWLTWVITKPIRILRATAARYAQGDLSVRIGDKPEFRRRDELSELARDFDHMASRIDQLMKSQQQLLADISHELRSPLARLSLALDLAQRRLGDAPEHQRMEREIQRLNELIGQLLTLARLEDQPGRPVSENVNVKDLVYEVAADATFEAEAAGRKVVVKKACDATIRGSRALLRSAIENVVRNAVRHTPENTEVAIDMERLNGVRHGSSRLQIAVRDHGPGVPPQALDRLFDPFFRVDAARDRRSGGVGLGLAITRQAVKTHGGTATAENHREGGLLIRLELPLE
jgi:two-component system sensor histidine kinase CpxA